MGLIGHYAISAMNPATITYLYIVGQAALWNQNGNWSVKFWYVLSSESDGLVAMTTGTDMSAWYMFGYGGSSGRSWWVQLCLRARSCLVKSFWIQAWLTERFFTIIAKDCQRNTKYIYRAHTERWTLYKDQYSRIAYFMWDFWCVARWNKNLPHYRKRAHAWLPAIYPLPCFSPCSSKEIRMLQVLRLIHEIRTYIFA